MRHLTALCLSLLLAMPAMASDAEYIDISALQAKLAAQEARLADIEAKMTESGGDGTPSNITSLRKNAKVTVGGLLTTGYYFNSGKVEYLRGNKMVKAADVKTGSLSIDDAELHFNIDVNEHFDAGILMDLHNVGPDASNDYAVAKEYWIRWKNICNSGFGLMVGRNQAAFGDPDAGIGYLDSIACGGGGDGLGWWLEDAVGWNNGLYNGWKFNGTTQVTPYWEGLDGKLKVELSFMQSIWNDTGALRSGSISSNADDGFNGSTYTRGNRKRSRNYGLGTMSGRVTYSPIEDLTFSASVINFRSNKEDYFADDWYKHSKNNTAAAFSFSWRPSFLKQARIWTQWVHGWNVNQTDGYDSDVLNYGLSWDFNDRFTVFAQGDYMRTSGTDIDGGKDKYKAWAAYVGGIYTLPYGVMIEAGWRHDSYKSYYDGQLYTKVKSDMIYANIGFEF